MYFIRNNTTIHVLIIYSLPHTMFSAFYVTLFNPDNNLVGKDVVIIFVSQMEKLRFRKK